MFFVTVAAISGYAPVLGTWRFSLRPLLIATTLVATMLGLETFMAKTF
jgi:hypothetical protein